MAKQVIGIGTTANDHTGDSLRVGMGKVNDNFTELYNKDTSAFGTDEFVINASTTLTNNAITYVTIGNKTLHESIYVTYRLRRGAGKRQGGFDILNDSSALYMSADSFISNDACTGNIDSITFGQSYSGNNIRIDASVNNQTSNVTMYYDLKRKLI